jgi:excisionase family DNA binding protein
MSEGTAKISSGGLVRGYRGLASYLGVSTRTAVTLRSKGFPHYRIGRGVFFKTTDVDRFLEEHCKRGSP